VSVLLAKTLRSTTFRVALLCILIFGAVVIALFAYVYWATSSFVMSRSDGGIEADTAALAATYRRSGRDGLIEAINKLLGDQQNLGERIYLLADRSLKPLAGNLDSWPANLADTPGWADFAASDADLRARRLRHLRAMLVTLPDGCRLLAGRDVDDLGRFAARMHLALALAVLLIFTLAGVASVAVTRRTVGRIESVNATTRAIMQSGLGERVPLRGTQDEWDQLAGNLNSMLDRIEALMGEVKQVTDNVAHDLRTPLTRIRGRLEKACIGGRNPQSDQLLLDDTMADLDDVLRMFASLTRISQVEASNRTAAFRCVDLVEIAQAVVELFDAAAEDRGVRLTVTADRPVPITGDRDLLFDALANLVDNAIKHGRGAGQVVVDIRMSADCAVVSICDEGPGIPADQHQLVFRRFYRLERSRSTPGNGLGLSLVAAVVRLHEAGIKLGDNAPGLKVELLFPAARPSPEKSDTAFAGSGDTRVTG